MLCTFAAILVTAPLPFRTKAVLRLSPFGGIHPFFRAVQNKVARLIPPSTLAAPHNRMNARSSYLSPLWDHVLASSRLTCSSNGALLIAKITSRQIGYKGSGSRDSRALRISASPSLLSAAFSWGLHFLVPRLLRLGTSSFDSCFVVNEKISVVRCWNAVPFGLNIHAR
jgi:hypothetical protein